MFTIVTINIKFREHLVYFSNPFLYLLRTYLCTSFLLLKNSAYVTGSGVYLKKDKGLKNVCEVLDNNVKTGFYFLSSNKFSIEVLSYNMYKLNLPYMRYGLDK